MWKPLSAPEHEPHSQLVTGRMESFGRILSELANRPYASKVYGAWSHACLYIGTAPNYQAYQTGAYRLILSIEPLEDRFRIGYGETASSKWGRSLVGERLEERGCWEVWSEQDVVSLVDRIVTRDLDGFVNPLCPVVFRPEWRTSTVVGLADQMYKSGEFSAIPILADALEDAGCDNDDILSHCRGDGSHVRGCWVVNLILGKE